MGGCGCGRNKSAAYLKERKDRIAKIKKKAQQAAARKPRRPT